MSTSSQGHHILGDRIITEKSNEFYKQYTVDDVNKLRDKVDKIETTLHEKKCCKSYECDSDRQRSIPRIATSELKGVKKHTSPKVDQEIVRVEQIPESIQLYSLDYSRDHFDSTKCGNSSNDSSTIAGAKPKKRLLVKQPSHGKLGLQRGEHNTDYERQGVSEQFKGSKSDSIDKDVSEHFKGSKSDSTDKDVSGPFKKGRRLPTKPSPKVRHRITTNESSLNRVDNVCMYMRTAEPILKLVTDDTTYTKDAFRTHFYTRAGDAEHGEFVPLQNLSSKQEHSSVSTLAYKNKYKERIRLRQKSKSTDDSTTVEHQQLYASPGKGNSNVTNFSDGRKSVAFSTVHASNSQYDNTDAAILSGELNTSKPTRSQFSSQQKQFLSPDHCVLMIEKSKSLQRLANQSSTETSGLGETVTSGLSSQESIASYCTGARSSNTGQALFQQDQGIDLREDTRNIRHEGNSTFGTGIIDSDNIINDTNEFKKSHRYTYCVDSIDTSGVSIAVQGTDVSQLDKRHGAGGNTTIEGDVISSEMTTRHIIGPTDHRTVRGYKPPLDFRSNDVKKPDNLAMFSANVGADFESLFTQSKSLKVPAASVGLQLEQINNEWNKHKRSSSVKSRSSQGSFRSRSGSMRRAKRFLSQKESQWMKWGNERRLSFRRRMENLEKPPEPEIPRASTPVKKARQEGLMFIHPDLESKYITEDDINYIKRHKQERLKTTKLIEKSKTKLHLEDHTITRLKPDELMTLSRFWEHRVFVRTRYVSILLSLVTTIIYILSICSTQWISYPSPGGK